MGPLSELSSPPEFMNKESDCVAWGGQYIVLPSSVDVQATVDQAGISRGSVGSRAATDYMHRHFSVAELAILQPAVLSHLPSQRRGLVSVEHVIGIRYLMSAL